MANEPNEPYALFALELITPKLVSYLKALKKNEPLIYDNDKEIKMMEEIAAKGSCFPNSVLFTFVNVIQNQDIKLPRKNPQDNFNWFLATTNLVWKWDGSLSSFTRKQRKKIDRLINHILLIAFPHKFFHKILDPLEISQSIEIDQNRHFEKIFGIAGLLSEKQLSTVLDVLPCNSSILVGAYTSIKYENGHMIGIYKRPDGTYFSPFFIFKDQEKSASNMTRHIMLNMRAVFELEEYESSDTQQLVTMNIMAFAVSDSAPSIDLNEKYLAEIFKMVDYTPQQFSYALAYSACNFADECTNYLISKAIDFNQFLADKWSALHVSVHRQLYDQTETLISKGANIYLKNIEGMTPLNYAIENKDMKTIKLIIAASEKQKLYPPLYYYARYVLLQNEKYTLEIEAYYHQNIKTLDSAAKKEIIVWANKYHNASLLKRMFLSELNAYIYINTPKVLQASLSSTEIYESFWSKITGFSLRINVAAATQLREAFEGKPVNFNNITIKALRSGFLGETLARFEKVLPDCFLEAECQYEKAEYKSNVTYLTYGKR